MEMHTEPVRVPMRAPFAADALFGFLATRAVAGVEAGDGSVYRRTLRLPHGPGALEARWRRDGHALDCRVYAADPRDLADALGAPHRIFDTAADPARIDARLGRDPVLAPLVERAPGTRSPGQADGFEMAVRAVLGQQVSVASARTVAAGLTARYGTPLGAPVMGLTHLFPSPDALAAADPADLPMPAGRKRALLGLARAVADGEIDLGPDADVEEAAARMLALPGIGPWTVGYVRMRAFGDGDAFLPTDIGVRNALRRLGRSGDPKSAEELARNWTPFRSYALHHLWAAAARPGPAAATEEESP
ncbi:3-methyladenine DNA glycosylase/8-oxoguanine DNA glycosylase [Spinactinospora alkalitolerans]|uniref:DNA-3-methyladenine glycosylase II n=2 Tax=Spinactinospora alkalitolerans TaxID=687207 RepID=A0A852U3W0_9ACTN|nr:3-methyladenine DNA glycosylase/8-oxoguanine DNA glycosylase [Spinactinospora alkalitolerans]